MREKRKQNYKIAASDKEDSQIERRKRYKTRHFFSQSHPWECLHTVRVEGKKDEKEERMRNVKSVALPYFFRPLNYLFLLSYGWVEEKKKRVEIQFTQPPVALTEDAPAIACHILLLVVTQSSTCTRKRNFLWIFTYSIPTTFCHDYRHSIDYMYYVYSLQSEYWLFGESKSLELFIIDASPK